MNQGISTDEEDVSKLRQRLRNMTDKQLIEFRKNVKYLCSPEANFGQPPLKSWTTQLQEARAEWRKRHQQTMQNLS
jgi:hypothetical protein